MNIDNIDRVRELIKKRDTAIKNYNSLCKMQGNWDLIKLKVINMQSDGGRSDIEITPSVKDAENLLTSAIEILVNEMNTCENELKNL